MRGLATSRSDIHFPKPRVVTITQATETGQVYSLDEIRALSATCRELGLRLHMDGARFANACASLDCSPADMTWKAGVDLLCFGGTKNGMAVGEAILFFDPHLAEDFDYRCKQAGQLASKMRFLAAPWVGLLKDGAWLRNARHANACAARLAAAVADVGDFSLMFPVEANAVFLRASADRLEALRQRGWQFYTFIGGGARFMFAWDSDDGAGGCAGAGYQGGECGRSSPDGAKRNPGPCPDRSVPDCAALHPGYASGTTKQKRRAVGRAVFDSTQQYLSLARRRPRRAVAGVALEEQRLAGDRRDHRGLERL